MFNEMKSRKHWPQTGHWWWHLGETGHVYILANGAHKDEIWAN